MSESTAKAKRPDYGIDAPGAVRNLAIGGVAALVLAVVALALHRAHVARLAAPFAISWLFFAGWMLWDSKIGKVWARERLLDSLPWRGDEAVLDVGCGRGLLLIGAAKRLR